MAVVFFASDLQRSEQYFTCAQSFAHFLRQTKGRPQTTQVFAGRSDFLRILGMGVRRDVETRSLEPCAAASSPDRNPVAFHYRYR